MATDRKSAAGAAASSGASTPASGAATGSPVQTAAALAKAAFRRLAQAQLEPTPENYARAYADESGQPTQAAVPAVSAAVTEKAIAEAVTAESRTLGTTWVTLVERLARNLERGGRQWTGARRKESLKRVLDGSRSDPQRLLQRLQSLMTAWEGDMPSDPAQTGVEDPPVEVTSRADAGSASWTPLVQVLESTVRSGLMSNPAEDQHLALADRLAELAGAIATDGATPELVSEADALCVQARRLFSQGHHLLESLSALCRELGNGLFELAEDNSWVAGQCELLQMHLGIAQAGAAQASDESSFSPGAAAAQTSSLSVTNRLTVRGVRAARTVLSETRQQQHRVRQERVAARDALKQLIQDMLAEVGELGEHTGRFQIATAGHAQAIASADSLEGLAGVVHAMLEDARNVQSAVSRSQERLLADRSQAEELEIRVRDLESELRRLSQEVSTDALTQVANRRGLSQAFEAEVARAGRESAGGHGAANLAVGLIDIDNFKRLNDTLGHAVGDTALKSLAAAVRERLRPADHLARFGGEEFVVLLPSTVVEEGQKTLTRLQRSLTEALFLHDGREVFVTFSAGVTAWREGETIEAALERADEALYEAKRTGKNRTCIA